LILARLWSGSHYCDKFVIKGNLHGKSTGEKLKVNLINEAKNHPRKNMEVAWKLFGMSRVLGIMLVYMAENVTHDFAIFQIQAYQISAFD